MILKHLKAGRMASHDRSNLLDSYNCRGNNGFIEVDTGAIHVRLSNGAKVTDVDDAGNTSLHIAARNLFHLDAVSLLLEQGADAALRNAKQDSSVHIAAYGIRWISGTRLTVEEKFKWQSDMLERMVEAGVVEPMSLPNAEGNIL
ncbi:uncharacterized protein FTOL_07004 [Fusarium torulosum]|uniref:Ankyrin repeat protein n=1 Tax=Fusarium torulosum TaxID=33205 RepID=A0AAE8MA32_9HYPO|nr:uncharacterized protein FTOL_07004 [Fusarium torulosum]